MLPGLFKSSPFDAIHTNGDFECSIESFIKNYTNNLDLDTELLTGSKIISNGELHATKANGKHISDDEWGISREGRVPVEEYDKVKGKNRFILNVSRGCPFGCEHCLVQLTEGRNERRRSLENLEKSLSEISKKYKHIKLWAANFTLDKNYVKAFCDLRNERFQDITWECATRIDLIRDLEFLELMRKSGCKQISIGVESLKNKELIGTKDFNRQEISKAIFDIQNAGMKAKCCIMLGMKGQTKADVLETFNFLNAGNALVRPTIYTPYHLIDENATLSDLYMFNRKTYKNENIEGLEYSELLELINNPSDYLKILGGKGKNFEDYER